MLKYVVFHLSVKCKQTERLVILIRKNRKKNYLKHFAFKEQMAFTSCGCRVFCCNIKACSISSGDEGN